MVLASITSISWIMFFIVSIKKTGPKALFFLFKELNLGLDQYQQIPEI